MRDHNIRISLMLVLASLSFSTIFFGNGARADATKRKCFFVNSYHKGYEWSDGEEVSAMDALKGHCEITTFYMDAKNHPENVKEKALQIKTAIEKGLPDVVITADDDVAENLIKPYFKDAKIPFVFCGINWSVKKYGFPYSNVTGMVEISPVLQLLQFIQPAFKSIKSAVYLAGDVAADIENLKRFKEAYSGDNIRVRGALVKTMAEWEKEFLAAQTSDEDFIILANNVGIKDWDKARAEKLVDQNVRKLTVTNHEFMARFAMVGLTKVAQEQGEWAGKSAVQILNGTPVSKIKIEFNRTWKKYMNAGRLKKGGFKLD